MTVPFLKRDYSYTFVGSDPNTGDMLTYAATQSLFSVSLSYLNFTKKYSSHL